MNRADSAPPIRIVLVDDHGIVRDCLTVLIEKQPGMLVVGSAADGKEAVAAALRLKPDLIIMDLVLRDMNGTDATEQILELLPATRIIVLSACHTAEHVYRALRAGAQGYVVKSGMIDDLLHAVLSVVAGRQYLSPGIASLFIDGLPSLPAARSPMESLSTRERQVLHRIVAGASSAAIAEHLSLSRKTVDTYRGRLMAKLGVGNRSALIRLAIEHELMAL